MVAALLPSMENPTASSTKPSPEDAALVSSLTSPLLAGGGETKRSEPVGELSRRERRLGASGPPAPQAVTPSSALSWTVGPGSRGTERGKQEEGEWLPY